MQVLDLVCIPSPQVFVHVVQAEYEVQPPSVCVVYDYYYVFGRTYIIQLFKSAFEFCITPVPVNFKPTF